MRLEDEEKDSQADALVLAAEVRPNNAKVENILSEKQFLSGFK